MRTARYSTFLACIFTCGSNRDESRVYPLTFLLSAITVVTINGSDSSWLEWNSCFCSALRANYLESFFLESAFIPPLGSTGYPTIVTTLRFIRETSRIKKFLFANRKDE